jgi:hypothetical protein
VTRGAPAALCRGGEGEGWLDSKRDDVSVVLTVRGKRQWQHSVSENGREAMVK